MCLSYVYIRTYCSKLCGCINYSIKEQSSNFKLKNFRAQTNSGLVIEYSLWSVCMRYHNEPVKLLYV